MHEPRRDGLHGAAALVTGASRGLGRALAAELARRGARVAMVARDRDALSAAADAIRAETAAESGSEVLAIDGDVGDPRDVERIAAVVHDRLGALDLLVNNAAALGPVPLPLALDLDPEDLVSVLRTNVIGPMRLVHRLVGPMVLRGSGTVVALSSDAAVEAYPGWGAYGASKAAHDHLMRTLAVELDGTGVRFVVLDPGEMDTDMHRAALPDADPATLTSPADAAREAVDRLADPVRAKNGARLVLAHAAEV
jgi:NAD(P)-dependent dehydrogenase (short-subunit alcohol dehydrogenase family)